MTVSELQTKQAIDQALRSFNTGHLAANALALFQTLGYQSDKKFNLYLNTSTNFITTFDQDRKLNPQNALLNEWQSVDFLFQLTWDEITGNDQLQLAFDTSAKVDTTFFTSYLFFAIGLRGSAYTSKQLDAIAREINKLFFIPVMILFRHGSTLTLSIINRRRDKRNDSKDVLEKVKHIKDIPFASPTLAHIKIFFALSLAQLHKKHGFSNFDQFHEAWQKTLDGNDKFPKEADPKDSIRIYLQEIGRIRLLMPDEEIELARKIADLLELERVREQLSRQLKQTPHDTEWANAVKMPLSEFRHRLQIGRKAKNKMVESNLRLVVSIAKKYQNRGVEFQDLIQEGNLGLIRASEKFDYNKGNRFSTYATWWIRQAITRAIADQSRTIRLPVHLWEKISRIKKTTKLLSQEMGRSPKKEEIATRLEMTTEKLTFIVKSALPIISLNTRIGDDEDSTLADLIEVDGETPAVHVLKTTQCEALESLLEALSPREQDILQMRYGLDDGREKTLEEIGRHFNLTRERIRQIEAKAFDKLRTWNYRRFIEENVCSEIVKPALTKNVTRNRIGQTELDTPKKLSHPHCGNVFQEQVSPKRVAPAQEADLIAPNASLQKTNLEEKTLSQAELSSADKSETKLSQVNSREANLTLVDMRKTDLSEAIKTMEQNSADLLQQLASVSEVFSQLGVQLKEAAREMQDPGTPLSEKLIKELSASRKSFMELRTKVLEMAESMAVSPTPKSDEIVSLTDIKSILQTVATAEAQSHAIAQVRQQALMVLERVLALAPRNDSDLLLLQECQAQARTTYRAVSNLQEPDLHPEAKSLAAGVHPLAALLTLISDRESLEYKRLEELQAAVAQSFGMPLVLAALTGRLIVRAELVPEFPSPSTTKGSQSTSLVERPEPETVPIVEQPPTEESDVASADSAISLPTTKVIPDEQPVETLTLPAQTKALEETVTPPPPKVETRHDAPDQEQTEKEREEVQPLYQFSPNYTARQIATSIRSGIGEKRPDALRDLIWQLLREDKLGLAFHLARCLENQYPKLQPRLPSWLIRAVALGLHVRYEVGEIANLLKDDFTSDRYSCFFTGIGEWNHAVRLLLAAAALRPALLAPNTGASSLLHQLHLGKAGLDRLYDYCQIIARHGEQQRALDPRAIKKAKDQAAQQKSLDELYQKIKEWWFQAPQQDMIYGPAKKVFLEWLKPDELIHSLLLPVIDKDLSGLPAVKEKVKQLSDESHLDYEIERTDRKIRHRRGGDAITAKARIQLHTRVRQAVDLVRSWVDIQESCLDQREDYLHREAKQLRQDVWRLQEAVLKELDAFEQTNRPVFILAGISCCRTAVKDIGTLFNPDAPLPTEERYPRHILHADLLRIPSLSMNDAWELDVRDPEAIIDGILHLVANDSLDWQQAFDAHSYLSGYEATGNHEATARIIEYLEANPETSLDIAHLKQERNNRIEKCRTVLQQQVEATRKQVEEAVALGLLRETDRADNAARIERIENALKTTLRFPEKLVQLRDIVEVINKKRHEEIDKLREKLNTLQEIGSAHPAYARICSVLDKGDVLTANEYIDMVQKGQPIPEPEKRRDAFIDFFKNKYAAIEDVLEPADRNRTKRRELINNILKGRSIGPLQMQQVPGAQAKQAAEMLDAWFTAKGKKEAISEGDARQILSYLGFNTARLTVNKFGRYTWIDVTTEPIQDRNRCPVPAYGSEAKGHYRILCVWDRPTEEDLLNAIGETSQGSPVIVFHFGRMTEKRRRDLGHLCRERRRLFIVIDDALMFYLCGERRARLPVLFECTLPFTFLEPYTTTSGFVPPEMFYGRERERDSIKDPTGSCFIYGGRQLGKTVLLRYVERTFHSPKEGRIALWLDLKAEAICYDRDIDEIWNLLATEFKRLGVLPDNKSTRVKADELLKQIQTWLDEDEKRCILLLLDEADRFLEFDGKKRTADNEEKGEFIRAARLKGLMDRTNRRFKVVFAGLHNVQRTTRLENHPLAHLGEPICIGPLLNNGEMRSARALVERPFASIGYRFESPDLITRILSQTNYYPSLIQLYCQQLLRHVTNPDVATFDPKTSPPYVITFRQVDAAYQSQDLRQAIRDRFMWTLQLDQRYEIIAYSIAYGSVESEKGMVDGFSVSWIRNEVLTWWYKGFHDLSSDEIRVLLEEMVGLGVLRVTSDGCFTLRSPNVLLLMGTPEEIEAALLKPREAPLEYEPATFRSALGIKNDSRRSPLTAQQESKLQSREYGVSIIFGCKAAGIDDLKVFLESVFSQKLFHYLDNISAQASFTQRLKDIIRNRQKDGTTLVIVPSFCPWSEQWVNEAIQQVGRLTAKDSFVRIVFVADPQTAWQLVNQNPTGFDSFKRLTIFSLKPWHDAALRQWLEDSNFPSDKDCREKITTVTGNWPALLARFYQNSKSDIHRWEFHLHELKDSLNDCQEARSLTLQLGLERHEQQKVLRVLAQLCQSPEDRVSTDDLVYFIEDIQAEVVNKVLRWADLLSLASPAGKEEDRDCWRVNPVVGCLLQSIGE